MAADLSQMGPPLAIVAHMLQGEIVELEAPSGASVSSLKEQLAPLVPSAPQAYQLKLFVDGGNTELDNAELLKDTVLASGAALTIVVGPSIPPWAVELDIDPKHPAWLREHFEKYSLEPPPWLSDDAAIWEQLRVEYDARDAQKAIYKGYGHRVHLESSGQLVGQVRAAPGSTVEVRLRGHIWNNNRNTCIQQCGLALGPLDGCQDAFLAEIYNGVPSSAQEINRVVQFKAPMEPGVHLLYRFGDLQYSFRDALRQFSAKTTKVTVKYPSAFVGWLIVE